MRNAYIVLIVTTVAFMSFLLGDYLALFGTSKIAKLDYVEVNFKTVDEETGAPVVEVHARCFQKKNRNACSEVNSGKAGYLALKIPIHKIITRSHLFIQSEEMVETEDPRLRIMFIHYDYANPVETFMTSDLPKMNDQTITVTMPRKMEIPAPETEDETQDNI